MKTIIIIACVAFSIVCCNHRSKRENRIENKKTDSFIESKEVDETLPDSLFYKLNMSFFDMKSIPYDESTSSYELEVAFGNFRQKVINGIKELGNGSRTNVWYLSRQAVNKNEFLITVYIQDDLDSRAIYLLSLDKTLDLIDYRKIACYECDLLDQTDTCEISSCNKIVTYKTKEDDYTVVTKEEKTFDCSSGKRVTIESDSSLVTIKNQKFVYKKL